MASTLFAPSLRLSVLKLEGVQERLWKTTAKETEVTEYWPFTMLHTITQRLDKLQRFPCAPKLPLFHGKVPSIDIAGRRSCLSFLVGSNRSKNHNVILLSNIPFYTC